MGNLLTIAFLLTVSAASPQETPPTSADPSGDAGPEAAATLPADEPAPPPPPSPPSPPPPPPPVDTQADESNGVLFGDVVDGDSAAPVAGVGVTATLHGSNTATTVATDAKGSFRIESLQAGSYSLTFHKEGFVAEPINDIVLAVGAAQRYDAAIYNEASLLAAAPETPKQKRKRLRRERWQEIAGVLGDKAKPAKDPALKALKRKQKAEKDKDEGWKLKEPELRGYVQVHFRQPFHTGADALVDNNDFRVQRVRIGAAGEVLPWLGYVVEVDPRAPEIRGLLRDAYLELKGFHQRLRIGQQKTQFGYENAESSTELYAVNRSEMADSLARANNLRDVGLGLIGFVPLGGGFKLENALTLTNGAGLNVQADDTPAKNLWGRVGARFEKAEWGDLDIRVGGSGGWGDFIDVTDGIVFRRVGTDVEVDQTWFFVSAEYAYAWDFVNGEPEERAGYYVNVVGKSPWSVGPTVRYDAVPEEGFERYTFGAYWGMPNDLLRVMINYELRLLKDGERGDDKLFIWTQVEF